MEIRPGKYDPKTIDQIRKLVEQTAHDDAVTADDLGNAFSSLELAKKAAAKREVEDRGYKVPETQAALDVTRRALVDSGFDPSESTVIASLFKQHQFAVERQSGTQPIHAREVPEVQVVIRKKTLRQGLKPPSLNRNGFLKVAAGFAGLLLMPGAFGGMALAHAEEQKRLAQIYGRFIDLNDGRYVESPTPKVFQASFIPEPYGQTEGSVFIRREPTLEVDLQRVPINQLPTSYATKVFGAGFNPLKRTENSVGTLKFNGERGGQWLLLTDENGTPFNPYERLPVQQGEKPFYTSNDFRIL